jgi:UDP-N-acetylmuramyl tripeptide synthase
MLVAQTLKLLGPNRRSDKTLIEQRVRLDESDIGIISTVGTGLRKQIEYALPQLALEDDQESITDEPHPVERFLLEYAITAVGLQRLAGHQVTETAVLRNPGDGYFHVIWEHEHSDVGRLAGILALRLICELCPKLDVQYRKSRRQHEGDLGPDAGSITEQLSRFLSFASARVLPRDACALIEAAQQREIPCVKLDREPYQGISGEFRIRPNGMLMFGHCRHQQIVDGTFSLQHSVHLSALIADRKARTTALRQQGVLLPAGYEGPFALTTGRRVRRAATQIGFPLVVKPAGRNNGQGVTVGVDDEPSLAAAVETARRVTPEILLERVIPGRTCRVFVVGFAMVCVLGSTGDGDVEDVTATAHASLGDIAVGIARYFNAGILVVSVVVKEPGEALVSGNGAVVNVDLAPWLDRFLPPASPWLDVLAERYLAWLFPSESQSRIPTIAVTGTNGKTTTSRMLAHIMRVAGKNTGMACTEGVYINDEQTYQADIAILDGHYKVFESPLPDVAILEHHHAGLANAGLAARFFDVVICTNVTADHLGHYGINNVEQMSVLKRSLAERGRDAVVLNADDPLCVAMISHLACRMLCLVSMDQPVSALRDLSDQPATFCCIETVTNEDWIVLYQGQQRRPLLPCARIPATFDGKARFNTCNAMHAICAAILSGVDVELVVQAMTGFRMSVETTPGRLNVFENLPFTVIIDYAHNPDGVRRLGAFVKRIETKGRKIFLYSGGGDRTDQVICDTAIAAAGHFDHYALRDYPDTRGRPRGEIPDLMYAALVKAGIPESRISLHYETPSSVEEVLQMAESGDIVTIAAGTSEIASIRNEITDFAP